MCKDWSFLEDNEKILLGILAAMFVFWGMTNANILNSNQVEPRASVFQIHCYDINNCWNCVCSESFYRGNCISLDSVWFVHISYLLWLNAIYNCLQW